MYSQWNFSLLFRSCLWTLLLWLSWLLPWTRAGWDFLDLHTYFFFNYSLVDAPFAQQSWALMNSRYGDWLSQFLFLSLFLVQKPLQLRRTIALFLAMVLSIAFTQILINKGFFLKGLHLERASPSLVITPAVDLATLFPLLNNKSGSVLSFPGDHATTLFLAAAFVWRLFPRRYGFYAWFLACLFTLPRLVSGAHWLTDAVIGAGSIALMSWGIFFGTPLFTQVNRACCRLLNLRSSLRA